ncbi:hypothetical protein [Corynebacterium halotolerans]|uniref:Uncharacterized protein n=1 Tax=Corynebacterium halotolerans YIM 70093 = DSM 44683 TaxID=1121362 RepID=M1P087_9CORY|nr:hypothetical protein [Corynebacterium halotolerans]AGF73190.1 hypothetical protein A605_10950 [Corynebacterium halotolerans YIM 70093 = DSM 44683]
MLFEFLYFIPDRTRSGRVHVDPYDPLEATVRRMEATRLTSSPLLRDLEADAAAIARRIAVSGDPSVPDPSARQLGDRTMLVSLETDSVEEAFNDLVQLAIDADVGLAELSSAQVYLHGDDSVEVSLEMTELSVPWTSPAALRSYVHRTNPANVWDWVPARDSRLAETGYLDEFLLLTRHPRADRFIQTHLDQRTGAWVIEVAEEGRRYTTRRRGEEEVTAVLHRWLFRGMAVLDDGPWRSTAGTDGVPRRDGFGRFIADPALDEGDDGDSDDGGRHDDAPSPTPPPTPVLVG